MTSYTLFSQAAETVTGPGASGGGAVGVEFSVSEACTLNALWLYSPSGQGLTAVPPTIGLYTTSNTTLVTSQAATWSGAPGSGWVSASFTSPPSLTAGTNYTAVVYDGSSTAVWFIYNDASWAANITNGPLSAVAANQGLYNTTATGISYPSTQLSNWNWFLDVQVTPATPAGTPAPFYRQGKAVTGARAARKGTAKGSPGVPLTASPPVTSPAAETILQFVPVIL